MVLLTPMVLQLFDTWTQYVVIVVAGVTVTEGPVAPAIGFVVLPEVPVYHWKEKGAVPETTTESVVELPAVIVGDGGFVVIATGMQTPLTFTRTAASCEPHGAVTCTQKKDDVAGETTVLGPVAPLIGLVLSPRFPLNHW